MRILAIETSCDETAVALLEITGPKEKPEIKILGNSLLSQIHIHKEYGGVYPHLAKREHIKNLPPLLEKTLKEAGESSEHPNIDFIAVTQGPGLEPALWTGIEFAKELSRKWDKPIVPVNHMAGHIFSVLYPEAEEIKFPALALLVSGGHTELVYVRSENEFEIIGQTQDDAVGEAFDKVARILGLPYPGGPKISNLAEIDRERNAESKIKFPRPMIHSGDYNFSYSGLKTAVLYHTKKESFEVEEVARAFEDAAVGVLIEKTRKALGNFEAETLIIGGGVAANKYLRTRLESLQSEFPHIHFRLPAPELATDNAVMIGIASYMNQAAAETEDIKAQGNLSL